MTGYTVLTGTSKKFTEGFDNIFDSKKSAGNKSGRKKAAKKPTSAKAKTASKLRDSCRNYSFYKLLFQFQTCPHLFLKERHNEIRDHNFYI